MHTIYNSTFEWIRYLWQSPYYILRNILRLVSREKDQQAPRSNNWPNNCPKVSIYSSFEFKWTIEWLSHSHGLFSFLRKDSGETSRKHEYTELFYGEKGYKTRPAYYVRNRLFFHNTLLGARSYNAGTSNNLRREHCKLVKLCHAGNSYEWMPNIIYHHYELEK
jgi:hypothetical protein